ncbi:cytochrome c oxidase subunit I [Halovivax limisalsi]|uniref:cytochrome c oxidase subunit I n=1 Tax=Halovivax limisalsi TaxID=1453760 RepID=UPI001FFCD4A0|nr:cbb3-type cytochrome c oxidase subunit I [Halovivax limisalsi]
MSRRSTPLRTLGRAIRRLRGGTFAVGHRRLARWYLGYALAFGLWGGLDALLLRTALVTPWLARWSARTYNAFFTTHGVTMLFLFALPAIWGIAYAAIPPLVGADGQARPRLGVLGFALLLPAAASIRAGTVGSILEFGRFEPVATGWTLYAPLSAASANPAVDTLLVGLLLVAVGTTLTGVNLVATIVRGRSVPWTQVDAFAWTVLTSAAMAVVAFPVLALAAALLLADRTLGTAVFAAGGGPTDWLHLFWFFAHPLVYVLVLPPMGIVSHVLPRFSGRRLVGRRSAVYSTLAIGVVSFGVWGHHLFVAGIGPSARLAFMAVTLAVALPSSAKLFTWLATLWGGSVRLTAPMLAAVAAVGCFVAGGVTGVALAVPPIAVRFNGTYFVVAHFHLLLPGFVGLGLLSGVYYWYPLATGYRYHRGLARLHVRLTVVGVAVAFGALLLAGIAAQPRRVATYRGAYVPLQQLATAGAYVIAAAQLAFLATLARSLRRADPAPADPWSLADAPAHAREWRRDTENARRRAEGDRTDGSG